MSAKALSNYILTAKYANHIAERARREVWSESKDRVFGMHRKKFAHLPGVETFIAEAERAFGEMLALGSQRVLQFGGAPVLKKEARGYNCTSTYVDRSRVFQEAFWLLLCGCGAGFSVQWHHVAKLPVLRAVPHDAESVVYMIPDTIEGWADALGVLLASYFIDDDAEFTEFSGRHVVFDYSGIRLKGAALSSGTGKAPGPDPLRIALDEIRKLLDRVCAQHADVNMAADPVIGENGRRLWAEGRLQPIDAYDIIMHASDAVLSGGVRRSASICIFSVDDKAMAQAKTGPWRKTNGQRARSNNSALLLRTTATFEQFQFLVDCARQGGDPGFYWSDSTEQMPNPCVEASFYCVDAQTGLTGWQFCNLSIINMAKVRDVATFRTAARAASIMGTLQAAYTSFEYLGPVSERITRREALLGVSMTGMAEAPDLAFNPMVLCEMAQVVLDTNEEVATLLGINKAARATLIKPEGTSSLLLGTCSGIGDHHDEWYLRRVQANELEVHARFFKKQNPRAVEPSSWSKNKTDLLLTFCIEAPAGSALSRNTTALDMLARVKLVKENWVDAGKRPECCTQPWLSHNVSNTIYLSAEEWEPATRYIFEHRHTFAGIALLDRNGDLDYPQAPFCAVLDAEEIAERYGAPAIMASGLIVDGVRAFDDDLWKACDTADGCRLGVGVDITQPIQALTSDAYMGRALQIDWVRRAKQFAERYFGGDVREMTYCLKHVANLKLWCDLQRETVEVDYTQMREDEDGTHFEAQAACAGGSCLVV